MKTIAFMQRRPDMDRAAFRDYYESRHAPLAVRYLRFERYVRNHLLEAPDIGFDALSEFWIADFAVVAEAMAGPVGTLLHEDEERFLDRTNIRTARAEEHVFGTNPAGGSKRMSFLRSEADAAPMAVLDMLAATGGTARVDFLSPLGEDPPPYQAIISIWGDASLANLPANGGWKLIHTVAVARCETPARDLQASFLQASAK